MIVASLACAFTWLLWHQKGLWTEHQDLRGHIPFIPCILVSTTQEWNRSRKNPAVQLKECRWPRIGGGLLLLPTMKWLLGSNLSQFDRLVYTTYRVGHTTNRAMRTTRVVCTTDAVTSAYNWWSNWHKFSKMFTTDRVVCTTDTNVHTTIRVNVYNWQNSAYNWQSNNYTNRRRIHLQPTG